MPTPADSTRILFLGKRRYTNQDALTQRFGRVFQVPRAWHRAGYPTLLILVDYFGRRGDRCEEAGFSAYSVPALTPRFIASLLRAAKMFRPAIIIGSGDCFIGMLAYWLARKTAAKFVFDVYDDYRTLGSYRGFLGWDALGFLCRRADLVVYASTVMAAEHKLETPCVVAPNGVDDSVFRPAPMAEARDRLRLPRDDRLVGYFGSMSEEYGVEGLIAAVQKLRAEGLNVRLLLCGKEHPCTPVDADGVLYCGMVPHREIPDYLNACDVLALPYRNGDFLDKASSCKIAEYLYCRRPIVATRTPNFVRNFPEQARQLESFLVEPGDVVALSHAIQRQLDNPFVADPPTDMSWEQIANKLLPSLQRLIS